MKKVIVFILMTAIFQTGYSQTETAIEVSSKNWKEMNVRKKVDTVIIDTVRISKRADTVKVGPVTIIQCRSCNSSAKAKLSSIQIGSDRSEKKQDNVEFSSFEFEIGVNNYIDKSNYGTPEVNNFVRLGAGNGNATEDLFALHTFKSINVNIWPVMVKVNLIKHILNLRTGIGIEMNNYRYARNLTYVNDLNRTHIELDSIYLKKNKLFTEYLTIPVLLHLNTHPLHDSKTFHFSVGPTFGLLVKSRTKQKSYKRGKVKNNDPFNLEKFRTGLRAEIGYGFINFYGSYSLTPIHSYGLKQYPFSIGISLNGYLSQ